MSIFNKNTIPSIVAVLLIFLSTLMPEPGKAIILSVGLFALSGALTNWLAIHMLFQRVPGLYGSGVIPLHFEEFKSGILQLVTKHLFKRENVEAALKKKSSQPDTDPTDTSEDESAADPTPDSQTKDTEEHDAENLSIDLSEAVEALDLDIAYDQLTAVILESSFGAMLGMVGGAQALEPMRNPFKKRMQTFLIDTTRSPRFQKALAGQIGSLTSSDQFLTKIQQIVQARLDELTPEMVRDIVQEMIRKHLGWLVVWGGVFGGLIGLISALFLSF